MSEVVKKGLLSVKRSKNRLTSVSTALNIAAILDLVVTEYCNSLVRVFIVGEGASIWVFCGRDPARYCSSNNNNGR